MSPNTEPGPRLVLSVNVDRSIRISSCVGLDREQALRGALAAGRGSFLFPLHHQSAPESLLAG